MPGVLVVVRYVVPGLLLVAGVVVLVTADKSVATDGFGLLWGAAFSLFVFAQLVRLNTSGADDRDREQAARDFYRDHGYWEEDET